MSLLQDALLRQLVLQSRLERLRKEEQQHWRLVDDPILSILPTRRQGLLMLPSLPPLRRRFLEDASIFHGSSPPNTSQEPSPLVHSGASDCLAVLQRIGSECRSGPFVDVLMLPGFTQASLELRVVTPTNAFPFKLHKLVSECRDETICRFMANGRAFLVVDKERFVSEILPKYFKQSQWGSFQRQLHNYGFERVAQGPYKGAFYHELFIQDQSGLMTFCKRVESISRDGKSRTSRQLPNFGQLRPAV